jgi:hypothetical protein
MACSARLREANCENHPETTSSTFRFEASNGFVCFNAKGKKVVDSYVGMSSSEEHVWTNAAAVVNYFTKEEWLDWPDFQGPKMTVDGIPPVELCPTRRLHSVLPLGKTVTNPALRRRFPE